MSKQKDMVTYPVKLPSGLLLDIDTLRKREDDLPSRAEMVRRLIYRAVGKPIAPLPVGRPSRREGVRPR